MTNRRLLFAGAVILFTCAACTPQFAQERSKDCEASKAEMNLHTLMARVVRTIDTAEVLYNSKHASLRSWQALLADQEGEEHFNAWLARFHAPFYRQAATVGFAGLPEVLPGRRHPLLVEKEGQSYLLFVEDFTDKSGFAYPGDERGIVRDCRFLP